MTPQERKANTEALLRQRGIATLDWLPVVEREATRSVGDVVERAAVLALVAVHAEFVQRGAAASPIPDALAQRGLVGALSPEEARFLGGDTSLALPLSWRYEAAWTLFWTLGLIDDLPWPDDVCDVPMVARLVRDLTPAQMRERAAPRSDDAVLDALDLTFRLHWAARNARIGNGTPYPEGVDEGVVEERHKALNWLTGFGGDDWDDMDTPT